VEHALGRPHGVLHTQHALGLHDDARIFDVLRQSQPIAAAMVSPGTVLDTAAYAVGTNAPGLMRGIGMTRTAGGMMLDILTRLMLPIPPASSALSNALSRVPPSAAAVVPAANITDFFFM